MLNRLLLITLFTGVLLGRPQTAWAVPTAVPDVATTAGRTPITFSLTANDTGSPDPATVDLDGNATNGTRATARTIANQGSFAVDNLGNLTFTPVSTFTGTTTSFTYIVRDAQGVASQGATVSVLVGPLTTNDVVLITYQTARVFRPTANDVVAASTAFDYATLDLDLGQAGIQPQRALAEGTLLADASTGDVTFTPTTGYSGDAPDVTYAINAQNGAPSSTGTIRLRVGGRPFVCTGEFYQISQPGSTAILYRLSRSTNSSGQLTYSSNLFYDTGTTMNGLAFSGQDGYLYAIGLSAPYDLFQLSQDGVRNLGKVTGLPASSFNSATADNQGNYYLANNTTSTLYRVDLKSFTATSIALSQSVQCGDIAFSPSNGLLYTSRYPNDLYSVDLASASATKPVTVLSTATTGDNMGSIFFDAAGSLYGAGNAGNLYLYDLATGQSTNIGSANNASQGDGASCAFPAQSLDVVKVVGTIVRRSPTVYDVPYTIRARNTSSAETPNIQVNEFLYSPSGTNTTFPGATSVVVAQAPVVSGDLPASAVNSSFTGQGSGSMLLIGAQALQAGQTATITFTARVTYPSAGAVPAQAYNTAYASTATTRPNMGYQLLADGTLVSPDQVLDADRSTNSTVPPSTRKGDTPAATPANFTMAMPLPVSLREFTAIVAGNQAQLTWATASELRNDRFEVERSADGQLFQKIGTVAGHGTSSTSTSYVFEDEVASHYGPVLYYRLRQVDTDETAAYSPVRVVKFGDPAQLPIALYPTPTRSTATLDLRHQPPGLCAVAIYDLTGRQLASYALVGGVLHTLDVRRLPTGISLVRVNEQVLRLVKEE